MTSRRSGRFAAFIAAGSVLAGGAVTVLDATNADALSSNCRSWSRTSGGWIQAWGQCASVGSDTKVRVVLDIPAWPNKNSQWFWDRNQHSTSWAQIWRDWHAGNDRIEQARR